MINQRLLSSGMMMETVRTSETSVNYFTRQYIPEDNSEHHTHRRENLKSHRKLLIYSSWQPHQTVWSTWRVIGVSGSSQNFLYAFGFQYFFV